MRPPLRLCDVCEARVRARACVGESGRGAAEAMGVGVYAYVVWGMDAEMSCGGRGDQVQVYAVGMLMAPPQR